MNYAIITIGGTEYKLCLTTRGCVQLEKVLGYNPLQIIIDTDAGKLPKLSDMAIMLNVMLNQYNHGISLDKVYDLLDAYMSEGHQVFELVSIFVEVFQAAGFIAPDNEEIKN